jgi:hypothetical protein
VRNQSPTARDGHPEATGCRLGLLRATTAHPPVVTRSRALGFISFIASVSLLLFLTYKLVSWGLRSKRSNQFIILIFNLLLADMQQSLSFLLNVEWLRLGAVEVSNSVCFAQGLLVSTGDLGSGLWCFAIGLHTFASVILDFRLKPRWFYTTICLLWVFIFGVSSIGIGIHGKSIYVRSGVWCWIHVGLHQLPFHVQSLIQQYSMILRIYDFGHITSGFSFCKFNIP